MLFPISDNPADRSCTASTESDDVLSQRFSNLANRSGSDSDLARSYGASSTTPLRPESRKSSYAGVVHNTFMSESFDNISDLASSSVSNHLGHQSNGFLNSWMTN